MDISKQAKVLGSLGGTRTSRLYGLNHYKRMQALGVETKLKKRAAKLEKSKNSEKLTSGS